MFHDYSIAKVIHKYDKLPKKLGSQLETILEKLIFVCMIKSKVLGQLIPYGSVLLF